ncbi:MAG: TraR/DksA C4-type zinc finger protein [Candidatus Palauibacterales bacterium]|nr:TraR/DksA C4-type zinc finger protein [Candidatus Palauibacterales bacterium]
MTTMDDEDLKYFEDRLLEERASVLRELGQFDEEFAEDPRGSGGGPESYSFHMADEGTDAMEREKKFMLASQEGELLYQIDEALRRMYRNEDEYGICQECGDRIARERLDAIPYADLCIDCQEKEEGASGEL